MKVLIVILLAFFGALSVNGQTGVITTVCGNGYHNDTGDGGPASAASISNPNGFGCFDRFGNYYFCVRFSHIVRKISNAGIITRFAGTGTQGYAGDGGPATAAQLNNPRDVVADSAGNIFIAETEGSRVRKVDIATGVISTYAGNGLYLDTGDGGQATAASFLLIANISLDALGNMYVCAGDSRIRKIDAASGIIHAYAGISLSATYGGDGGPATAAHFYSPNGLFVDASGNLIVADFGNARIRKIDVGTGIVTTIAGNGTASYNGEGIAATSAQINPIDVRADLDGNMFFTDQMNFRIRRINNSGLVYTVAGTGVRGFSGDGGPADTAQIGNLLGLSINDCGNLYFADISNYRIRKVTFPGNDKPSVTITASSGNRLCYGMPVTFRASTARGGRAPVYQWKVNGTTVGASAPTYTYTPANGDSVQCVLTSNSYCVVNPMDTSNTLYMSVGTLAPPVVAISGISSANTGSSVTLTAAITGSSGAYTLQWANHGTTFATTTVPSVTYTKPAGNDTITATLVSMGKGCYDSVVSNLHVVKDPHLGVAGAGSESRLVCYPNPVGNTLFVSASEMQYQIRVYDLLGQVIYTGASTGNKTEVPMIHVARGIYIIKCIFNDGTTEVTRFIKQ